MSQFARWSMRSVAVSLSAFAALGCVRDRPEATAGADTAKDAATGKTRSAHAIASYPNGGALVADPVACTVARVQDTVRWTHTMAPCESGLDIAVALDSTAVVRTGGALIGLDPEGAELWRVALPQPPAPQSVATPAITRDSMAVIALTPQLLVAYRKGQEAWRVTLPASEALVAPPTGSLTEGVLLASARGVRALGADGSLRWTTAPGAQTAK